jgi:hypothetical protein
VDSNDFNLIIEMLKADPGMVYIAPTGKTMLLLVGPEQKLMYIEAMADQNFTLMPQEEIEQIITNFLT